MEDLGLDELNIYADKRVFVTGHTGFKGSWLTAFLRKLGSEVCGYSLKPEFSPNHFDLVTSKVGKSIFGDIRDIKSLGTAINEFRPDIVFHLAAQPLVRDSYEYPIGTYESNVMGTLNLLEACKSCDSVTSVICVTTDKVYDNREWVYPYRESDVLGGYDMYSSSKACCEILISSYRKSFLNEKGYGTNHNKLISSVRAGNVVGGGDWSRNRLIPDLMKAASNLSTTKIRNPHSIRPWQHVLDCLYGYILVGSALLKGKAASATAYNFAPDSSRSFSVSDIIKIATNYWTSVKVEYEDIMDGYHEADLLNLDSSKAKKELGWYPQWNTETAISKTVQWYKEYYEKSKILTDDQIAEFLSAIKKNQDE